MATYLLSPALHADEEGWFYNLKEEKSRVPLPVEGTKVLSRRDNNVHLTAYNFSFFICN